MINRIFLFFIFISLQIFPISMVTCLSLNKLLDIILAGSVLLVYGYIPVALSKSEGAGSVWILVQLTGAHLYIQVLGNERTKRLKRTRCDGRCTKL